MARKVNPAVYISCTDFLLHNVEQLQSRTPPLEVYKGSPRKPSTPWYNDEGKLAGVVHQERGWQYVLFLNAGHLVGQDAPVSVRTAQALINSLC